MYFRYQPSQADVVVLSSLKSPPTSATPNVLRWYKHIQSYNVEDRNKFAQKSLNSEISKIITCNDKPTSSIAENDDVDLFGSDDEEVNFLLFLRNEENF